MEEIGLLEMSIYVFRVDMLLTFYPKRISTVKPFLGIKHLISLTFYNWIRIDET